jgi:hypothetical protein
MMRLSKIPRVDMGMAFSKGDNQQPYVHASELRHSFDSRDVRQFNRSRDFMSHSISSRFCFISH